MPNKSKRKGSQFEMDAVKLLSSSIPDSNWKRVPTSGAIGTTLGEPLLYGDIRGEIKGFPRMFRVECKVGYGGATQFALKKEWLDKIIKEAYSTYSTPLLMGKFSGARGGANVFVVLDFDTFADLMNYISKLKAELEKNDQQAFTNSV
jgi:hypothetical protein